MAAQAEDSEASGYAALTLGSIQHSLSRLNESEANATDAIQHFERAKQYSGAVRALNLRATIASGRNDSVLARALLSEALVCARQRGLRLATEEILLAQSAVYVEGGCWKDAENAIGEALRLALQDGRPRGVAVAYGNLALLDAMSGRPARASRRGRTALRLMHAYLPRLEPFSWRVLAQAHRTAGRMAAAERAARAAISGALRLGLAGELEWARLEFGRTRAVAGAWSEAEAVWERALVAAGARESLCAILLRLSLGRALLRGILGGLTRR